MRPLKFREWNEDIKEMEVFELDSGFDCECGAFGNTPIMQSTGLKDKNGKEIYEGDIVYEICRPDNEEYEHVVDDIRRLPFPLTAPKEDYPHYSLEVTGNIYENEELNAAETSKAVKENDTSESSGIRP